LRNLPIEPSPRAATFLQCCGCMWTVGPDGLFCGRGKIPKSSYCLRHFKRAHRAADPS
jgi:hypothetical protein